MAVINNDSRVPGPLRPTAEENTQDPSNAIRAHISRLTGLPMTAVRLAFVPRPGTHPGLQDNWCALSIDSFRTHGTPVHKGVRGELEDAESGVQVSESHQTIFCEATFYGPNAPVLAGDFREGFYLGQNDADLNRSGLWSQGVDDDVLYRPDFFCEQWVPSYIVKFRVGRKVKRVYGVRSVCIPGEIRLITEKR